MDTENFPKSFKLFLLNIQWIKRTINFSNKHWLTLIRLNWLYWIDCRNLFRILNEKEWMNKLNSRTLTICENRIKEWNITSALSVFKRERFRALYRWFLLRFFHFLRRSSDKKRRIGSHPRLYCSPHVFNLFTVDLFHIDHFISLWCKRFA